MGFEIPITLGGIPEAKKQLEELKQTAQSLNGDELKSMNKDIEELSGVIENAEKAFKKTVKEGGKFNDLIQLMDNGVVDVSGSISKMEDALYAMVVAGEAGSEEFIQLQVETANFKQTVIDVDKEIDLLAENRGFASIGGGIGQVAERLATLDFEGAGKSAEVMNKNMMNLGKMGTNAITGLVKTVGNLTSAFVKMGLALLTNPIFLISAAILAIVAAVAAVLDSLGLLQPVLDGIAWVFGKIGDLINWVVDGFKALTDWIGITDHAGEEMVNNQIKKFKEYSEAMTKAHDERVFQMDEQIKIAQAQGKDTLQLEQNKQRAIRETAKQENKIAELVLKNAKKKKDADDEEIIALEEKIAANKELIKLSSSEIRVIEAKKEHKAIEDTKKTEEERARQAKENAAAAKKYAQDRINFERQIQDLIIESMEEGLEKELSIQNAKYERQIEDTKRNESILQSEKAKIIELLTAQQIAAETELRGKAEKERLERETEAKIEAARIERETRDALLQELEDIDEQIYQSTLTQSEREVNAVRDKYFRLIEAAKEYDQAFEHLEAERDAKIKEIQDAEYLRNLEANAVSLSDQLAFLEEKRRIELENTQLTEEEKLRIEEEYAEKRKSLVLSTTNATAGYAMQGLNAVQGLSDAIFSARMSKLEKGSQAELAAAKKQFEINKKLQIAGAIIQGVQAVLAAYSSGSAIPIVGAVTGPLFAALAAATVVANVAKIKNSKFEGGGASVSAPSASMPSVPQATPQINMFGSANNYNEGEQGESVKQEPIKVVAEVSEYEISETQKTTQRQRQRSEL